MASPVFPHLICTLVFIVLACESAPVQAVNCMKFHKVKADEACSSILKQTNLTASRLLMLNPKLNCSDLHAGQLLCIALPFPGPVIKANSSAPVQKRKVFMEYLGADEYPVRFTQAPINSSIDFYFILSFAVDADDDAKPQNGFFREVWSETLDPEAVTAIKSSHSNVKVLMSLAGWSVSNRSGKDKVLFWYDPTDQQKWIQNAYTSIASIVNKYSLDGIDIDYESFHHENTTFSHCIGELITRLKKDRVIQIATIAPFSDIESHYIQLYQNYSSVIDYVNYQFYTTNKPPSIAKFVRTYMEKAATYGAPKVLVSLQIYERGIQGNDFFTGVHQILNATNGAMPGIMIWSLDDSVHYKTNFWYETESQAILAAAQDSVAFRNQSGRANAVFT